MSVSSSVWSLQFPTAWAYLPHLYEKPWGGEDWEPDWFSYICIQCLEAMRKEPPPPHPRSLAALQLQTTWEKGRAIYIFKNGSGMKVIGAAESVNKCNTEKERKTDDTWNLLAEICGRIRALVTFKMLPCCASHLLNQIWSHFDIS